MTVTYTNPRFHYRQDIDGLRTLAVVVMATIIMAALTLYPSQFRLFGKETNAHRYGYSEENYLKKIGVTVVDHLLWQEPVNSTIDSLNINNLHIIDPLTILADKNGYCKMEDGGHSLYYDDNHLSKHGALLLSPLFSPLFKQLTSTSVNAPE